ncbi:MAG: lipid-A-disaccharide synthase [Gemmatimonadaceae bacterium]
MREVLILAGEASGDLHAAGLASALGALRRDLVLTGMGGPQMERAGVQLFERIDALGVMGFVEVLRQVPHHWALLRELRRRLQSGRVALLIVIDYPGFNMRAAEAARSAGVPVLYYITPQVWAWGAGRLPKLARLITKAAVILPFEEPLLRAHGIDATFVGHPLLDRALQLPSKADARVALGLDVDRPLLALFPGSRGQEIHRHLGPFTATALELQRRLPQLQVVVSLAPGIRLDPNECPFRQVAEASFTVLRAADAGLCKSGTTTLEAAVAGCPLIVAYRTSAWTHAIARRLVRIPRIGLVNIVADREVAREFVQDAVAPGPMADALQPLLQTPSADAELVRQGLEDVRSRLGEPGAARRVAQMASDLVP